MTRVSRVQAGGGQSAPIARPQQPSDVNPNLYAMSRLIGNEQDVGALNKWGLASPGALRFMAGGGFRRAITSMLTGIPSDKLIVYGQMADMMRVQGMQPDWAHLLVLSGVPSPGDLSRYASNDLGGQIQLGIVYGALAAKAIEVGISEGRAYSVPSYGQLQQLAQASYGLGSSISVPQPTQPQPGQ
jgi:hypothetical protein